MENQLTIKNLLNGEGVKKRLNEILGKNASSFIASVLQIVNSNELLSKATPESIYSCALMAATLNLPLNNNLGFAYIIPYNDRKTNTVLAQFQIGYKGFIQFAQRTGQFKTIAACPIYKGQLLKENPLIGFEFDFTKKESDEIIGYASYFSLINGFEKVMYSSVDQVKKHGSKFSQSYKKNYGLWVDDFDSMALKTVIKGLLTKFAPLSIDMQKAVITDQSVIKDVETMDVEYVDNLNERQPLAEVTEQQREQQMIDFINNCNNANILETELSDKEMTEDVRVVYETKLSTLKKIK